MYLYDEVNKIESEEEPEYVSQPKARFPDKYKVQHKTETGEIVFNVYGKNAPQMIYVESQRFVTSALGEKMAWWWISSKLSEALKWVKSKNANHAGLRTLLAKILTQSR